MDGWIDRDIYTLGEGERERERERERYQSSQASTRTIRVGWAGWWRDLTSYPKRSPPIAATTATMYTDDRILLCLVPSVATSMATLACLPVALILSIRLLTIFAVRDSALLYAYGVCASTGPSVPRTERRGELLWWAQMKVVPMATDAGNSAAGDPHCSCIYVFMLSISARDAGSWLAAGRMSRAGPQACSVRRARRACKLHPASSLKLLINRRRARTV